MWRAAGEIRKRRFSRKFSAVVTPTERVSESVKTIFGSEVFFFFFPRKWPFEPYYRRDLPKTRKTLNVPAEKLLLFIKRFTAITVPI